MTTITITPKKHARIETTENLPRYYDMTAFRELLIERKLIASEEIRRQIEVLDSRTPALDAKVVARAWVDPEFSALGRQWPRRLRRNGHHLLRRHRSDCAREQ
jgi:hypothetical protein